MKRLKDWQRYTKLDISTYETFSKLKPQTIEWMLLFKPLYFVHMLWINKKAKLKSIFF